jgi:hypothetical protein
MMSTAEVQRDFRLCSRGSCRRGLLAAKDEGLLHEAMVLLHMVA